MMESPAEQLWRVRAQQHRSSGSKERREHRREVHRKRVRVICQQESDDRRSQCLGLAEQPEQHNATKFPQSPGAEGFVEIGIQNILFFQPINKISTS